MKPYADTNIFTNFWLELSHTREAFELMAELKRQEQTLPVTSLLKMELTNALQRLVFESRQGAQSLRVSAEMALATQYHFSEDLDAGEFLQPAAINDDLLEMTFETLSQRHTARHGFRTYDILHVASALALGCDTFWSFDARAKRLAALEGLRTND